MSGRAETEMQIKIMTHWEDFCPTTMNQVRMMLMNSIRNEMQKCLTEENEIKEGQEKVEEELGNETKESTFSSPWKFCRNLLNEERGQMNENKIKEGQEEKQEDQGNKLVMYRRRAYINSAVLSSLSHVSSEPMEARYDNSRKQAYVEMEIRRLEIERFSKHALEEDMNITRILKSGSMFREVQIWRQLPCREVKIWLQPSLEVRIDQYEADRSLLYFQSAVSPPSCRVSSEHMDARYDNSELKQAIEEMKIRRLEIENFLVMYRRQAVLCNRELEQAIEELKISRLEIENFWKHALEKDMNIMRILESGSLRFLKQQIQDVWQLLRCKVCLDSDACMVFFPCRHMATCEYCGSFLDQCPVCRTFIEETVKVNKK